MAVCDLCKGTGRLLKPWYDTTGLMTGFTGDICFKCDGKGTIGEPMTKEEWFDTLTTKGKAEIIAQLSSYGGNVEAILDWLKEKHDGNI